jgi:hypothetical protein
VRNIRTEPERARLQPCRKSPIKIGALAPEASDINSQNVQTAEIAASGHVFRHGGMLEPQEAFPG